MHYVNIFLLPSPNPLKLYVLNLPYPNHRHLGKNSDLQELMAKLRTEPSNSAIQTEIREKRKLLKDQYYSQKATEINCAAEARQVEKEFILAKNFRMHKTSSSKIDISKEKLTKHFENIFWKGCVNFHLNW